MDDKNIQFGLSFLAQMESLESDGTFQWFGFSTSIGHFFVHFFILSSKIVWLFFGYLLCGNRDLLLPIAAKEKEGGSGEIEFDKLVNFFFIFSGN